VAALFNFEVHTPFRLFFDFNAEVIILSLTDGEIGVYAKHCAFIAPVVSGILRIKDSSGKWRTAFISDGILEVKEYKNVLICDSAEWPEEIDKERALEAKLQAEKSLSTAVFSFEKENANARLRRAEYRLKVQQMEKTQK
jgi:F-type H+-transporting ATPase subunit epsilon